MDAKILVLDIETKPAIAYVWRAYDENVGVEQVLDPGGMICFAAKWLGNPEVEFYSEWDDGRDVMVKKALELLREADAVVTFNGDKFDLPKLTGEIVLAGLAPPPPITSIDVIKTIRKLGLFMNRLAFVGPLLKVGDKIKHEGFELWAKVIAGDPKSRAKMKKYNIQDAVLLEKLYKKIKPFIKNHPHLGKAKHECGACGSNKTQNRGFRRTKYFRIQRTQCQSCGSWSDGTEREDQVIERDAYVIRMSESGDYFLVPLQFAEQFLEDEFNGVADYATYIDLFDFQIYDFEV